MQGGDGVDVFDGDVGGHGEGDGGVVEDGADACFDEQVGDGLGCVGGHGDDGDFDVEGLQVHWDVVGVFDWDVADGGAYFVGGDVEDGFDVEVAVAEARVVDEGMA